MPIYAYKCSQCHFAQDVLQKISDAALSVCPSCGQSAFAKQLTAPGFQLKGSGWYATDFKQGSKPATETSASAETGKNEPASTSPPAAKPESAPAPASACSAGPCAACS